MTNLFTAALRLSWAIAIAAAVQSTAARAEQPAVAEAGSGATSDVSTRTVSRASSGVTVVEMSLNHAVSVEGLDLNSTSDIANLEKRINDAAQAACAEISHRYPLAATSDGDGECVKDAVDKAMVRMRKLVAAAHEKSLASR